jgi:isopenicillin N synthase-like dioxygenase
MPNRIRLIDVSPLLAAPNEPARWTSVAQSIDAACRDIGFFAVTGHGLDVAGAFAESHRFFGLPAPAKQAVSIKQSPHNRGYVALRDEQLDPSKPADEKEAFNIGLELSEDDTDLLAGKPFMGRNLWPAERSPVEGGHGEGIEGFRARLLAYYAGCHRVGMALHRAFAVSLGLPIDWFDNKLDKPIATLRLLHYPAASAAAPQGLGAGEHTDYGNVTLLATDGVAGLQVRLRGVEGEDAWLDVPAIAGVPDALICNIGDCLMRWTNGVYVSTPHRVARPVAERYSMAFFLDGNPDAEVEPLVSCVSAERPAQWPRTTVGAYLRERLDATYQHRQAS